MSINKVDPNQTTNNKISELNDMLLEVNGKAEQGAFNKHELDQVFSDLGLDRKFTREASLGNALGNYTGWTHVLAESGYSIWKYAVADYIHNVNNNLYFDGKLLTYKGAAGAETASTFTHVYTYNVSYTDVTTEAGTEAGTEFSVPLSPSKYLYMGAAVTFAGAKFEFKTRGSNHSLVVEYFGGGTWKSLTLVANNFVDNTSNFESDGAITWTIPIDWTTTTVNSVSRYWIRISSNNTPVTTAKLYYVIPYNSVVALLALSSNDIQNENWAWCSFSSSVYVTIRNSGGAAYEGNYFLTSTSSNTNKQNFFVSNHSYTADYENWPYSGVSVAVRSGVAVGNMVAITDEYQFDNAIATQMARKAVGVLLSSGVIKFMTGLVRNVNTDGSAIVPGNVLYLSVTAGKVSKNAPAIGGARITQKVGIAISNPNSGNVVDMVMQIDALPVNS